MCIVHNNQIRSQNYKKREINTLLYKESQLCIMYQQHFKTRYDRKINLSQLFDWQHCGQPASLYNFIRETLIPKTPSLSKEMINSIKQTNPQCCNISHRDLLCATQFIKNVAFLTCRLYIFADKLICMVLWQY